MTVMKKKSILKSKLLRAIAISLCLILLAGALFVLLTNVYVVNYSGKYIIEPDSASELGDIDCILVLGCLVYSNGSPSGMLDDRLVCAEQLYESGASPKILMSGDHGRDEYDEVNAMKKHAIAAGVPSDDVFMDHAGFSTYESMYRAKEVFGARRIVIVTQKYHLYRAVYIARSLGIEAYGVASDYHTYSGQPMRELREVAARTKDVLSVWFKVPPTYLGEAISLDGSGSVTDDGK